MPRNAANLPGAMPMTTPFAAASSCSAMATGAASTNISAIRCRRPVEALRRAIYPQLAPIANRWRERLREEGEFPAALDAYIA